MWIYLVHHAHALPGEEDARRPLSPAGAAAADELATEAATRGCKPAAIWHSGKLRAKQTAEPFWRRCNALADFRAVRNLQPEDPPEWIRDEVQAEERDIMLVGHMPHIDRLLWLLSGAKNEHGFAAFPKHGVVALERTATGWQEQWRLAP